MKKNITLDLKFIQNLPNPQAISNFAYRSIKFFTLHPDALPVMLDNLYQSLPFISDILFKNGISHNGKPWSISTISELNRFLKEVKKYHDGLFPENNNIQNNIQVLDLKNIGKRKYSTKFNQIYISDLISSPFLLNSPVKSDILLLSAPKIFNYTIYTRTSSRFTFKNNSPDRQIQVCSNWLKQNFSQLDIKKDFKFNLIKISTENCDSELPLNQRPVFIELKNFLLTKPIEDRNILVEELSRIGRKGEILEEAYNLFKEHQIKIYALDNPTLIFKEGLDGQIVRKHIGDTLQNAKKILLLRLKENKALEAIKQETKGNLTYNGKGKVDGRKSIFQKYPKITEIILANKDASLRDLQFILADKGILTNTGNTLSQETIWKAKKIILSKFEKTSK